MTSPNTRMWVLYLPIAMVSSVLAIAMWENRAHPGREAGTATGAGVLLALAALVLAISLAWRRRFPVEVAVIAALVTLVLPLDPVVALIAFASLAVRRLDRVVGAVAALTFAAVLLSIWRDGRGTTKESSFWQIILAPVGQDVGLEPLSLLSTLVISLAHLGAAFALAMLVRDRLRARDTEEAGREHAQVVQGLSDELARQSERERLAQEVHDALGHRLSLLSLHAGALQLRAGDDPALHESASLVRWGAEQAMTDLRALLSMLRQPGSPDLAAAVPSLRDLALLIEENSQTGTTLISTVQMDSIEGLDELTSRSAFRVAQELLTNARRHAPGIGVRFLVRASPGTGIEIESANYLPPQAATEVRAGTGLTGLTTRVDQLGGQWRWWVDEQRVFRMAVHLPWVWRSIDEPAAAPTWPARGDTR
ncbi:MAG: histidine kinase [Actinomycetia bacterium]|nr:histidine kinase [Actinomycetes bacterium]